MFGGMIRYSVVMAVGFVGVLTACGGDSTGPSRESTAQLAAYYDAYAGRLLATGREADTIEAAFVEMLNGPIAYGQRPTAITLLASGSPQTWFVNGAIFVDSAGSADSVMFITLWRDTVVSSVVLLQAFGADIPRLDEAAAYATPFIIGLADTIAATGTSAPQSGACSPRAPVTHVPLHFPRYDPARTTCSPASIVVSGHVHFPRATGASAPLRDIDLAPTMISAIRLQPR
jgi:hypothetical protein